MSDLVDPCTACGRWVRASDSACPFCGAAHRGAVLPPRPPLRSRLAMVAGALLLGACGGGDATADDADDGTGSGGGEVVDDGGGDGDDLDGDGSPDAEASCAGVCGSHHHPECMDDDPPCPAPPYGAPPADAVIV